MSLAPARLPVAEPTDSTWFPLQHAPLKQYCENTVELTIRRWGFWFALFFLVGSKIAKMTRFLPSWLCHPRASVAPGVWLAAQAQASCICSLPWLWLVRLEMGTASYPFLPGWFWIPQGLTAVLLRTFPQRPVSLDPRTECQQLGKEVSPGHSSADFNK